MSIVAGITFRGAALEDEQRILSRIIEVASTEVIGTLQEQAKELGASTENDRNFRKAMKKPGDAENQEVIVTRLNDQFNQRFVTTGVVSLEKIRVYNKEFQLVAESSTGISGLPQKLPEFIYNEAKDREGGDRLKAIGGVWNSSIGTHYSVLVPVGGLRLRGYLEIIVNPAHNLKKVEEILKAPVKVVSKDGEEKYSSESWVEDGENTLAVSYNLPTNTGEPSITLNVLENIQIFNEKFNNTQMISLASFVGIIALGTVFAVMIFSKFVFRPLNAIVKNLKKAGALLS